MQYSPTDLIALLLFGLAELLFFGGTFLAAVLAVAWKGKKKAVAIDVLLWLATASILVSCAANLLPQARKGVAADAVKFSYKRKAELTGVDLTVTSSVTRLPAPWSELAKLDGAWTMEKAFATAKDSNLESWKEHYDDSLLASHLAIVMHEHGENPQTTVFDKYRGQDRFVSLLHGLYAPSDDNHTSAKAHEDVISESDILNNLPPGWYRDSVLKTYYEKTKADAKLAELNERKEKETQEWIAKYIIRQSWTKLCALLGLIALFVFIRTHRRNDIEAPASYGFRKTYGCVLAWYYAQFGSTFVAGLWLGMAAGFEAASKHTKLAMPNTSLLFAQIAVIAGALATFLGLILFICRPAQITIKEALLKNCQIKSVGTSLLYISLGYCCSMFVATINSLILARVGSGSSASNDSILHLVDAFITNDALSFIWICFWFCILAPLTEEFLMRVLIYSYVRAKLGIIPAVLISSAIFAAIHLQPAFFAFYMSMGVILALVYERTRSYPIIVGIHCLWNAYVVFAVSYLVPK